ncbi:ABC transporter permease [Opitutaceae bacterium TAV4]|nr:ABC transporter permease [Opitutaceae bacterium TAV4]RRJ98026.1 ABC transporter permease [Opitutaceae bacterium TAV4]RRK02561.1 ABC transporter permease [Opitutaceae bacterium TAV3]
MNPRRLIALCRKESLQIVRDPTTILIAFILPVVMLFIYGYGLNLDTGRVRIGLLCEDTSPEARRLVASFTGSPYLDVRAFDDRAAMGEALTRSHIRGFVVIPSDFSARLARDGEVMAPVQVVADGSEPNTANFVQAYVLGAWQGWLAQRAADAGRGTFGAYPKANANGGITIEQTYWFNPTAESRFYLIPGSITIIMTVIGALLTALVVAREWERGTMEALLASPISRAEFLLGKIVPYYVLGMVVLLLCVAVARGVMGVPFRGSLPALWAGGSLFLLSVLGMGLMLSTALRNQFNAAQAALMAAFLPAMMLSGFIFEIGSMPAPIRVASSFIPARYFVTVMQTIFQAGDLWPVLRPCLLFLACTAVFFLGLTVCLTRRRLLK